MAPAEVMAAHRDYYGSYHHHKETMSYTAATLYIGATTAIILKRPAVLEIGSPRCVLSLLLFLGFVVGHAFVIWQLYQRETGANIVRATTVLLTRLTVPNQPAPDMTATPWHGIELPRVLVDELTSCSRPVGVLGGARTASVMTVVAMLGWSLLALLALVG